MRFSLRRHPPQFTHPGETVDRDIRIVMKSGFVWSSIWQVAAKAHIAAVLVIAAHILPLRIFGLLFAVQAAAALLASTWDFGTNSLCSRQVAARVWRIEEAILGALRFRVTSAAPIAALVGLVYYALAPRLPLGPVEILALGAAPFVLALSNCWQGALAGAGEFRKQVLANSAGRVVALVVLPAVFLGANSTVRIEIFAASFLLGELTTLGLMCREVTPRRLASFSSSAPTGVAMLRLSLPYAGNNFLSLAYIRGDVLLVGLLAGATTAGDYAAASQLQNVVVVLPALLSAGLVSAVSGNPSSASLDRVRNAARHAIRQGLPLSLAIAIVTTLAAPYLVRATLGASLQNGLTPIRIIIWGLPASVVAFPLIQALIALGQSTTATLCGASGFIVSLLLHLVLDHSFGASGGAVASSVRDPVALLAAVYAFRRIGHKIVLHEDACQEEASL